MRYQVQYQTRDFLGKETIMHIGFSTTPFGEALVLLVADRLVGLAFATQGRRATLQDMQARFPLARYQRDDRRITRFLAKSQRAQSVSMLLIGTPFQHRVWQQLLAIPEGQTIAYGTIAARLGQSSAARAVASAIGRNPISWFVPCHRVVRRHAKLTEHARGLGGYHWGLAVKRQLLAYEGALCAA